MKIYLSLRSRRQLSIARAMIGVNVGVYNRFDPQAVAIRNVQILFDLELRIDDRAAALTPSTKYIGGAPGIRIE